MVDILLGTRVNALVPSSELKIQKLIKVINMSACLDICNRISAKLF